MSLLSVAAGRVYQSYLMSDRLTEYREILEQIGNSGYSFLTMCEYATLMRNGAAIAPPVCVLRVDVDTDPHGAAQMFDVVQEIGIRATFYFRMCTIDRALISQMIRQGAEVGYHFEELSTLALRRGLRAGFDIGAVRETLKEQFRANLVYFRAETGAASLTVAAHGDFLNRRLGVDNNVLLDQELMDELGIVAEVYQAWLWQSGFARVADRPYPLCWRPHSPATALAKKPPVLWLVLHPRQWIRNAWVNIRADVTRASEELMYLWNSHLRRSRFHE